MILVRSLHIIVVPLLVAVTAGCQRADTGTAPTAVDWQTSPLDLNLRGAIGSSHQFRCPPGKPMPASVTGSGVYTDVSSICAAAAHAGAIDPQHGGAVMIQILPGQPRYQGSTRNFIHSDSYMHAWGGSFAVLPIIRPGKSEP